MIVLDDMSAKAEHQCLVRVEREPPTLYLFSLNNHPGATLEEFRRLFVLCSNCKWVTTPSQIRFHVCHNAQLIDDNAEIGANMY
jgi:hypothetical protein